MKQRKCCKVYNIHSNQSCCLFIKIYLHVCIKTTISQQLYFALILAGIPHSNFFRESKIWLKGMPIILVAYILVDNEFFHDKYMYKMCIFGNCNFGSVVLSHLQQFAYHGENMLYSILIPTRLTCIYAQTIDMGPERYEKPNGSKTLSSPNYYLTCHTQECHCTMPLCFSTPGQHSALTQSPGQRSDTSPELLLKAAPPNQCWVTEYHCLLKQWRYSLYSYILMLLMIQQCQTWH